LKKPEILGCEPAFKEPLDVGRLYPPSFTLVATSHSLQFHQFAPFFDIISNARKTASVVRILVVPILTLLYLILYNFVNGV